MYRERIGHYEQLVDDLARRNRAEPRHEARRMCSACGLPTGTPCVGQLERDPVVLTAGAIEGERLVEAALGAAVRPRGAPR